MTKPISFPNFFSPIEGSPAQSLPHLKYHEFTSERKSKKSSFAGIFPWVVAQLVGARSGVLHYLVKKKKGFAPTLHLPLPSLSTTLFHLLLSVRPSAPRALPPLQGPADRHPPLPPPISVPVRSCQGNSGRRDRGRRCSPSGQPRSFTVRSSPW